MGEHQVTLHSNTVAVYGPTFHKDLPLPLMLHVELSVPVAHPPGAGSTHALTSTVMHQKKRIAQDGHDCGPDIIHVPVSVINILLPLAYTCAERKAAFSASTVLMNEAPTACCNFYPFTPMMACSELLNLPIAFPTDNGSSTVVVGMTDADYAVGWCAFGVSALAAVLSLATGDAGGLLEEVGKLFGFELPDPIKTGANLLSGVLKIATTGHGSLEVGFGNRYFGEKVALKRNKATGQWEVDTEGNVATHRTASTTNLSDGSRSQKGGDDNGDGTSTETEYKQTPKEGGGHTEEVTENQYDDQGNLESSKTTTTEYDDNGDPVSEPQTTNNPRPQDVDEDSFDYGEDTLL